MAEGLTALLGERVDVIDGPAVRARPVAADPAFLTDPATGTPGMEVVLLAADGTELAGRHEDSSEVTIGGDDDPAREPATAVLTTTRANAAGPVRLGAVGAGRWTPRFTSRLGILLGAPAPARPTGESRTPWPTSTPSTRATTPTRPVTPSTRSPA